MGKSDNNSHMVNVKVHTGCLGCEREGKPIMLSLDGHNSKGTYVFLDAFLTKNEAQELIDTLTNTLKEL